MQHQSTQALFSNKTAKAPSNMLELKRNFIAEKQEHQKSVA
jgi:hypothetical protein